MKRLALALLAVGAVVVAILLMSPWDDTVDLVPTDGDGAANTADGPSGDLVSEDGKKGEEFTASGTSTPDRKEISTARIQVAGRLVGDRGAALGDTLVHLHFGKAPSNGFWPGMYPVAKKKSPDGVKRTDGDGRFAFDVPLGKEGRIALAGGDLVWSKRPPRFVGSEENLDLGDLAVHKGATLSGLVLSHNDAPIDAAKLQFVNYENFQIGPRVANSDGAGKFEIKGLPGGEAYLTVSHAGHVTRHVRIELERGKTREQMIIRLSNGEDLIGSVRDDRGKPIADASVSVSGPGKSLEDGGYEYSNGSAKTDKNGDFRVRGLGAGPYQVNASAKGHIAKSKSKITLAHGPVRMELDRLGVLVGKLVDERGDPLVGSRVYATPRDPNDKKIRNRSVEAGMQIDMEAAELHFADRMVNYSGRRGGAKTDAEGMFRLENIKPGRVWLVANGSHREAVYGPVEVSAGEQADQVTMAAERGAVALVRVFDPDGRPVEKARVSLRGKQPGKKRQQDVRVFGEVAADLPVVHNMRFSSPKTKTGYTDKLGECELAGVEPGDYEVSAKHKSWVSPKPVPLAMPDKGRVESKMEMVAGGTVSVRVFDHTGKPAAEQSFRIVVASAKDPKSKKSSRQVSSGRTDATGRATVGPIAAGNYEAVLQLTGGDSGGLIGVWGGFYGGNHGGKEIGERVPFVVKAEETVEVKLTRPELAKVIGTLSDSSGPIRNGMIVLAPTPEKTNNSSYMAMSAGLKRTRTDGDGAFQFEGLQPGKYTLTAQRKKGQMSFAQQIEIRGPGEHRQDMFLVAGQAKIELLLSGKPVKSVLVTLVRKSQGNPYAAMMWQMGGHNSGSANASTDAKGIAHFEEVPPGTYSIRLSGKRFMQPGADRVAKVERGGTANLRLDLVAAATLKCECTPASGTDKLRMFQLELTLEGSGEKPKKHWMPGSQGSKSSLKPGRYTVRGRRRPTPRPGVPVKQAEWSAPQTIELEAGKTGTVRIILP